MPGWMCDSCGWHPDVEENRKRKIRDELDFETMRAHAEEAEAKIRAAAKKRKKRAEVKSDTEVLFIVRMSHMEFGVGRMTDNMIAAEFGIGSRRIAKAKKIIREELMRGEAARAKYRRTEDEKDDTDSGAVD